MRRTRPALPTPAGVAQFLRRVAPFDRLAPERVAALAARSRPALAAAKEVLFIEGAPAEHAWLLCSGRVSITCSSSDGRKRILETILPGELFGTLCRVFSRSSGYPCSAEAAVDSVVLRIPEREFAGVTRGNAPLLESLCHLCSHRLNDMRRLPRMAMEAPEARVAYALSRLMRVYGQRIPVKEKEVAEAAGLAVETAYRAFHALREARLVATRVHGIVALDPAGIRAVWDEPHAPLTRAGTPAAAPNAPARGRA